MIELVCTALTLAGAGDYGSIHDPTIDLRGASHVELSQGPFYSLYDDDDDDGDDDG